MGDNIFDGTEDAKTTMPTSTANPGPELSSGPNLTAIIFGITIVVTIAIAVYGSRNGRNVHRRPPRRRGARVGDTMTGANRKDCLGLFVVGVGLIAGGAVSTSFRSLTVFATPSR